MVLSFGYKNFNYLETFLGIRRDRDMLLDTSCGPIAHAEVQYGLRGFRIAGLGLSKTIKTAKESVRKDGNDGNVDFVLGDAEFLPFRENKFNVTLCIGTISHLPEIESVKRC
jgi:ubiquinone/menaquinone biosynthesis C-methylase UbiE